MEHTEGKQSVTQNTMERIKEIVVNKLKNSFFKMCKETKTTECLTCGKELAGVMPSNIKRHYRTMHHIDIQIGSKRKPPIAQKKKNYEHKMKMRKMHQQKILELKNCKKYKKHKELGKTDCLVCGSQMSSLANWVIKRHFRLVHNVKLDARSVTPTPDESDADNVASEKADKQQERNEFFKLCLGLVAVTGVSRSVFNDHKIFKKLIAPQEEKFGTNLNSLDILTLMQCTSSTLRDVISNKVKNKAIALILDLATGMYQNVLNISIQYMKNFKLHYNTLAIIQLDKSTSDIKDVVLNCLANYGIKKSQVHFYVAEVTTKDECYSVVGEHAKGTPKELGSMINYTKQLFTTLTTEFREIKSIRSIIQLTVADFLANIEFKISKYQDLVRELESMFVGQPHELILGNVTNWISIHKMFKSLLDNRVCLENKLPMNLKMLQNQTNWDFIKDIVNALAPMNRLNNQLNKEQYIFGDFYRDWLSCEIEFKKLLRTSWYAQLFVQSMHKYKEELLLGDESFLSAIYLDPRFNFSNTVMLSLEQKHKAEAHLTELYKIINTQLKNGSQTLKTVGNDSENPSHILPSTFVESERSILSSIKCEAGTILSTSYGSETTDIMLPTIKQEEFVESTLTPASYESTEFVVPETSTPNKVFDESLQSFKQKLIGLLAYEPMLQRNENVLQYWMTTNPDADITKILEAAFVVPVTQVTVGRAAKCLDEGVFEHDLLLIKYNFEEISDISIEI